MLKNYTLLTILLIGLLLGINYILTTKVNDKEIISPYECGFIPVIGQNRYRFEIVYYIIGLLFLGFDIEIGLLLPVLTIFSEIIMISYWIGFLFLSVLTAGFVYELKIKAIKF